MEEWLIAFLLKILNKDQELLDFMKRKYYNSCEKDATFSICTKKHGYFDIVASKGQGILREVVSIIDEPFQPIRIWVEHKLPIIRPTYITGVDINGKTLPRIKPWGDKEEKLAEILVHVLKSAGIKI